MRPGNLDVLLALTCQIYHNLDVDNGGVHEDVLLFLENVLRPLTKGQIRGLAAAYRSKGQITLN